MMYLIEYMLIEQSAIFKLYSIFSAAQTLKKYSKKNIFLLNCAHKSEHKYTRQKTLQTYTSCLSKVSKSQTPSRLE